MPVSSGTASAAQAIPSDMYRSPTLNATLLAAPTAARCAEEPGTTAYGAVDDKPTHDYRRIWPKDHREHGNRLREISGVTLCPISQ
jgi:hypothetical protein